MTAIETTAEREAVRQAIADIRVAQVELRALLAQGLTRWPDGRFVAVDLAHLSIELARLQRDPYPNGAS